MYDIKSSNQPQAAQNGKLLNFLVKPIVVVVIVVIVIHIFAIKFVMTHKIR